MVDGPYVKSPRGFLVFCLLFCQEARECDNVSIDFLLLKRNAISVACHDGSIEFIELRDCSRER